MMIEEHRHYWIKLDAFLKLAPAVPYEIYKMNRKERKEHIICLECGKLITKKQALQILNHFLSWLNKIIQYNGG